jgi:hypothetical protein
MAAQCRVCCTVDASTPEVSLVFLSCNDSGEKEQQQGHDSLMAVTTKCRFCCTDGSAVQVVTLLLLMHKKTFMNPAQHFNNFPKIKEHYWIIRKQAQKILVINYYSLIILNV